MIPLADRLVITIALIQMVLVVILMDFFRPETLVGLQLCASVLFLGGLILCWELYSLRRFIRNHDFMERTMLTRLAGIPREPVSRAEGSAKTGMPFERRAGGIELRQDDTPERIANVMVTSIFRQASLKYHPDHGGSGELMRRIVEAREMLLRASRY